ncbi:Small-conductance mechanosensitive channel [Candidatus Phaeomarinobacter ectocarpi]|uniref:Small-conductance mechanosensitive channel n=2 Tax=Candidatus Phaeomarinibacter ectocarpi TaxID=1458461 RepID=X5MP90_9HYPH|nr:Small-conductance mechanosensitive channel [Candidatus Phaeomarinobacter ectocarpi]
MDENIQTMTDQATETLGALAVTYGISLVGAIVILIIGFWVANRARIAVVRLMERFDEIDQTLTSFLAGLVRYIIIAVTILAVLAEFGVQTASLLAVMGAAGLAVGLALQGTLSNVAAGVMLLFLRPFKLGDYIEAGGVSGSVKAITLFRTELSTPDNVQVFVPNSDVWGSAISNYSYNSTRRVEIECGIAYDDDIGKAFEVMRSVVAEDARVLATPAPMVAVKTLGDSSVNVICRVWVKSGDYWPFTFDKQREIKEGYDAAGLNIPFPTRTVYQIDEKSAD